MTNQQHHASTITSPITNAGSIARRSVAGAALLALVASACGATTSTSSNPTLVPVEAVAFDTLDSADLIPQITLPETEQLLQPETTVPPTTTVPPKVETPATTTAPTVPPNFTLTPTPYPKTIDQLGLIPTVTIALNATMMPIDAPPFPAPAPCGVFGPIPAESPITSDLSVDLDADGAAHEQVITYFDGAHKLRSIQNGVISEVTIPDVGASSIRALGVGNVGEISAGNEIIVQTGAGASAALIGFFGHDDAGCLFKFTRYSNDLEMYVGASVGTSSGASCGEGLIAQWSYGLEDDGTYTGSSAAYFESSAGDFTYSPASDDFSEGLALEDLSPAELDCFGFGL